MRLKISEAKGDPVFFQQVEDVLVRIPGVERVEARPRTGSVVIEYKPGEALAFEARTREAGEESRLLSLALPEYGEAAATLDEAETEVDLLARHSEIAHTIVVFFEDLNQSVKRATDNAVDLRLLLPAAVAAYGSFFVKKKQPSPLWINLLLFSFNSFLSLHQQASTRTSAASESRDRAPGHEAG